MSSTIEVKKIFVDTRFRSPDSKSDSDFSIELPKTVNCPEGTVAYLDELVIPISWKTIDSRNDKLYLSVFDGAGYTYTFFKMPHNNYTGKTFCEKLEDQMNTALTAMHVAVTVEYEYMINEYKISITDNRPIVAGPLRLYLAGVEDIEKGELGIPPTVYPNLLNKVLRFEKTVVILPTQSYSNTLDLHTTRNLYLCSSTLASYNTISNFGNDTIVKKIPVKGGYNEMIFHESTSGFDYLDVSKRSLRKIDFRLVDSYFNPIDLRQNHFSFSIVFQPK